MRPYRVLPVTALAALLVLPARADRAAADRAIAEGEAREGSGDFAGAEAAYARAVAADPGLAKAWGRRGSARLALNRGEAAIADLTAALALEPESYDWRWWRAQAALYVDRPHSAIEDLDLLLARSKDYPDLVAARGMALVLAGDVDGGLAEQDRAVRLAPADPRLLLRAEAYTATADWAALAAEMDRRAAAGWREPVDSFFRTMALVELGRYDAAAAGVAELNRGPAGTVAIACRIYLASTPAAGPHHRPAELDADLARLREAGADSNALVVQARALVLAGRDREAVDLLSSKGRRTHFSTLFWLGAAYWKLGRLAEARVVLQDARRLNPHLAKHAARLPGLADFLASVAPESGGDRARLGYELATHLLTVAEIETLVRAYRFRRAAAEYEALLAAVTSGTRKADIAARLPEVRAMAAALDRIVAAVNRGQPRLKARVGGADLTLQKADEAAFDFTIPKGSGRFPWAFVGPAALLDMVSSCAAPPDDLFGLACVAWEAGEPDLAVKTFEEAAKHRPELRPAVAAFVARQRGIPVPAGGFALHQGRYVTPEEKARLSEGLVLFEGRWVTPKDRAQLARGLVRAGDRWVAGDEAELLRLGFRRHRGEWMSPGDYEALRGTWAEAWTADTAHFAIRTNQGEAFARDLASLLEAAWQDMHAVYGDGPKLKEKVAVLAFRTFEDWRTWCRDNRQEASLNAAGLARSDAGTVAGWNKSRNEQQFLQTMVHETAHLFWNRLAPAARTPSWYAEGMATEFEGFDWTGKEWRWDHVADTRVAFIRGAVKGRRQLPLQDLFGGDALALINSDMSRALLFYAQCWSVVHFLRTTDNPKWRAAGEAYRKELAAGGTRGLPHFLGDTAAFEKDWMAFVAGM